MGRIGQAITILDRITSYIPKKHRQGGQSQMRFQRLRQEALAHHYGSVFDRLTKIVPYGSKIIVGGSIVNLDRFRNGVKRRKDLLKMIHTYIALQYSQEIGLRELIQKGKDSFREIHYFDQKQILEEKIQKYLEYPEKFLIGMEGIVHLKKGLYKSALILDSNDLLKERDLLNSKITIISIDAEERIFLEKNCGSLLLELF